MANHTSVLLPGKSHQLEGLVTIFMGVAKEVATERLTHAHTHTRIYIYSVSLMIGFWMNLDAFLNCIEGLTFYYLLISFDQITDFTYINLSIRKVDFLSHTWKILITFHHPVYCVWYFLNIYDVSETDAGAKRESVEIDVLLIASRLCEQVYLSMCKRLILLLSFSCLL